MQACGNCYNGEEAEGTRLYLSANVRVRIDTLKFPYPQKLSVGTMETIIYLNTLCLL